MTERLMSIQEIPRERWPRLNQTMPTRVWMCDEYLVQEYLEQSGVVRLSISAVNHGGMWVDRIPWDVLQAIKARVGYGERWAAEVYPADSQLVNVANMRHLWLMPRKPSFAWSKS